MTTKQTRTILQTKFFYVITVFAVSLGTVSWLWEYGRKENWVLIAFGIAWVGVLTAFVWEIVTRAERLDAMVRQRTEELERGNRELAVMNKQLRELDEMKSSLISSVSHELRTPLTSIRSFSEILSDYDDIEPATRAEFTDIIREECDRLARLIGDLLDLAKISSGKMEWRMEDVDMLHVAQQCYRTLRTQVEKKGLKFSLTAEENLPTVRASADRLIQVFNNLVSNAVKFTDSGGNIDVSIFGTKEKVDGAEKDYVKVCVADTGMGIARENYDKIFEKFVQVSGLVEGKPEGTGLGLSISKEIVERSGGRIWVESELAKGSRFYFTIPVSVGS